MILALLQCSAPPCRSLITGSVARVLADRRANVLAVPAWQHFLLQRSKSLGKHVRASASMARSRAGAVFLYFTPLTLLVFLVLPNGFLLDIATSLC